MHTVAVVAFNGVDLSDFSTPCEMFRSVRLADGSAPYRVLVCATKPHVDAGLFTIQAEHTLDGLVEADTVVIPGVDDPSRAAPPALVEAVRAAAERGARRLNLHGRLRARRGWSARRAPRDDALA